MRTTVTIEGDTEALLREEMKRSGKSFKRVLNEAIQASLHRESTQIIVRPLFSAAFPESLEGKSMNHLVAEWDDESTIAELSGS